MNHALTRFLEPLEGRCHLSAAPAAVTPHAPPSAAQRQAAINEAIVAAFATGFGSATPMTAPLAMQPLNPTATDLLTASSAPDWLDVLVGGSSGGTTNPGTGAGDTAPRAAGNAGAGLATDGTPLLNADGMPVNPSPFSPG